MSYFLYIYNIYIYIYICNPRKSEGNPRVVGSSPTWDWLYISNRKTLAQQWISYISLNSASHWFTSNKNGKWSDQQKQNAEIKKTLCEGGSRWEI